MYQHRVYYLPLRANYLETVPIPSYNLFIYSVYREHLGSNRKMDSQSI